jgi:hypothetical protein
VKVIINNQSLTIKKDHLVSLKVTRVIGDSANEFTLEAFDETAWQLENALMGEQLAPITIMYSAANDLTKAIRFQGTCLNYQMSFSGKATLLTITGVLAATEEQTGWWFNSQAIEWCGSEPYTTIIGSTSEQDYSVDGKSYDVWSNYENNEDVCAMIRMDKNNNPIVYFNPTRIFERIIHTYNGDKLGTTSSDTTVSYTQDISTTNVTTAVWKFFTQRGFTEESTAAIMGNIQQESSFNPYSIENNGKGPAAGLFQWNNYSTQSGRWKKMADYATSKGKSWTDLQCQLEYALSEMPGQFESGTGKIYTYDNGTVTCWPNAVTLDQFKAMTDINTATQIFERAFERASSPLMDKRITYANSFYEQYKNSKTTEQALQGQKLTLSSSIDVRLQPTLLSFIIDTLSSGTTVEVVSYNGTYTCINYGDSKRGWVLTVDLNASSSTVTSGTTTMSYTMYSGTAVDGWGTGGTGHFKIGEFDKSRWIAGLNTNQSAGQTAAQYITNVLCKSAISDTGAAYEDEVAGFRYYVDANGHNFKMLRYNEDPTDANTVYIQYGQKNSEVISFSIANLGSVAMVGVNNADSSLVDTSGLDYLYGDTIKAGAENVLDSGVDEEVINQNATYTNWYSLQQKATSVYISSSSTENELTSTLSSTWNDLQQFSFSAELTVWGEYSNKYTPGNYLDISIVGPTGQKHYASGTYMILQIQDSVSSDGFTQTMKLLKNIKEATSSSKSTSTSSSDTTSVTSYTTLSETDSTIFSALPGSSKIHTTK